MKIRLSELRRVVRSVVLEASGDAKDEKIRKILRDNWSGSSMPDDDVQYLRVVQKTSSKIVLRDYDGMLGHGETTLTLKDLTDGVTLDDVVQFITSRGGKVVKAKRRRRIPQGPMGGYD